MEKYTYLIIGGGMAADSCVRGIREKDPKGKIGIISQEPYPCYDRPPLSKGLWTGQPLDSIWAHTEKHAVTFHLERRALTLDPKKHLVTDHVGNVYWYEKLLLATGGVCKQLECTDEETIYLHTLQDYYRLRSLYETDHSFIVIGSGYIATEIAAALKMNGKEVTMLFKEPGLMSRKLPEEFSHFLTNYYRDKGVTLLPNTAVSSVKKEGSIFQVTTDEGKIIRADGVIGGIGITPNIAIAKSAALKCDNGITVNRLLQTSDASIYAAGDVANFFCLPLGYRIRCEHEDAAKTMGYLAGLNMAGCREEYTHLPYFYSDLFEIGYMAMGKLSNELETVEDWQEPYHQGTIYYLEEGRVVGGMLWGIWDQNAKLREMITSKKQLSKKELVGSIRV
ncbi:MAG: Dicamba O-demethylase 2, ferredoxin reductase component [Chlamydiales bacterium]|nr:Dicamba O-demethylase 2, ferredoxin reductase component [Chlamydiales bacterium]MCH9620295.1 Dicamba O-demethylase 2, ferredoxin reductase component [Chlamydiales bacterium]MCH9622794.1 Dicamba O-demethylase 2, ferredoxin reductase component [Chlamydiales bacterium]